PGGDHEREVESPGRFAGRGDALGGVLAAVDRAVGVLVLDRAADGAGLGGADNRRCGVFGVSPVAVFEVDRDRKARGSIELSCVLERLLEGGAAVQSAEREREPGARRCQRFEAESCEDLCRARVPGVGDDERLAFVEGPNGGGFLVLGRLQLVASLGCDSGASLATAWTSSLQNVSVAAEGSLGHSARDGKRGDCPGGG